MQGLTQLIEGLASKGRITTADKKWITATMRRVHDHEKQMKMYDLFKDNTDMPYIFLFLSGAGLAGLSALLSGPTEDEKNDPDFDLAQWYKDIWSLGTIQGANLVSLINELRTLGQPDNLYGYLQNTMIAAGTSVSAISGVILLNKSIFGSGDPGGIGQLFTGLPGV